ncbi:CHASE2 domain-containing protein [Pseudanabaenaceae cyanobacterium LEGE 13415]|nr:CHASE2 domain-containing protein [Pseudanabaenaceae cyanobacterium LEGE 13415]
MASKVLSHVTMLGQKWLFQYRGALLSGITTAGCIFAIRSIGLLQILELSAFDRFIQLRPTEPRDDRIVLVGFTESDLQKLNNSHISDHAVATVLDRIREQKPRAIGLDLYRNLATQPGHNRLKHLFQTTPNLIGIEKVIGNEQGDAVPGNPVLALSERIGASDIIADIDGRVRRAFLFPSTDPPIESFSLRLALEYLAIQGISPNPNASVLQLDEVKFLPFSPNAGGYLNADAGGYQVLLNPRGNKGKFRMISAWDVMQGNIPPTIFRDRIVLIGDVSAGASDLFFTSYSSASGSSPQPMSGVELHANIISQIISAVLDRRVLIQPLPEWAEWSFILGLTTISAWLSVRRDSFFSKMGWTVCLIISSVATCYGLMLVGWWVPIVPGAVAIGMAAMIGMTIEAQRLNILSMQDSLTQLANRRSFDEALGREWERAWRSHSPLAVILCDVDYFKRYNDTYGHASGDDCLRKVSAAICRSVKRSVDITARYGGEEFIVLLPNTNAKGAVIVAERIRSEVESMQLEHSGSQISPFVTLSLGVSSIVPSSSITPKVWIEVADMGLYEAKQAGRNCVVLKEFISDL